MERSGTTKVTISPDERRTEGERDERRERDMTRSSPLTKRDAMLTQSSARSFSPRAAARRASPGLRSRDGYHPDVAGVNLPVQT